MSYWEDYEHQQGFKRCLLLIRGKSRRSPSASASLGIRASALDFQKDVEERRKERKEKYAKYVEESCNQMFEKLASILKEKNIEEKKKREQEEKEKQRQEKEEQEKESKENLISNDFCSPIVDLNLLEIVEEIPTEASSTLIPNELSSPCVELNLQEIVEELPKEAPSNKFPILKRKIIDIVPSAPLYIQPTFIIPIHVSMEEEANDCVIANTSANQKLIGDDLFLYQEKIFGGTGRFKRVAQA